LSIRILIADDYGILRAALRALFEQADGLLVIGEARDGPETLRLAQELQPDVILLDISMPGSGSIQVARKLRTQVPKARLLILTVHEDELLLRQALKVGVVGCIPKHAEGVELIAAIRAVYRGEVYVHSSLTSSLIRHLKPSLVHEPSSTEGLTPRETEVLRLVALGHTNRQIAELLFLSTPTVERDRANLMRKLGLHSRSELVRYARENGLLEWPA